jgi:hypothetical protein
MFRASPPARPDTSGVLLGGLIGTFGMTVMVYFAAPGFAGEPVDLAGTLAAVAGVGWVGGMILHFVLGALVLPIVYALAAYDRLRGYPWVRGVKFGLGLWLLAETILMPMVGAGAFHAGHGAGMAAFASLAGHLLYGGLLGGIAGSGAPFARLIRI